MKKYRYILLIVALGIILTSIFTWPFVLNIASYYTDQGDYATHGSILWYNQDSIKTGRIFNQQEYFKGYMFYPHPFSLAFANNHVFPSLIFAPIFWISNNLPLSVNLYVFLTFVVTFTTCFIFLNYFLKNNFAAIIGSFIFTFNAQIITRFPQHIELLGRFFLPLIFLFAYKLLEKPSFKFSFFLWLSLTLNSLTTNYFQIFVIIFLPLFAIPFLVSHLRKTGWGYIGRLGKVALVGLIFVPVILYFNLPFWQFSQKEGVFRSVDESIFFSARINDYFAPTSNNLFLGGWSKYLHPLRQPKDDRGVLNYEEHTLFLGILPLILFVLGVKLFWKEKLKSPFLILLIVSLILTFGPYLGYDAAGFQLPFYYLYQILPVMKGIRAPTRFEYIFYLPFSTVAAFGVLWLIKKRVIGAIWLIGVIGGILILENLTIQNYSDRSKIFKKIDQIGLDQLSFLTGKKTLHLPIFTIADADIFGKNSIYTNWLIKTGERMMNGNSGYFPPDILALLFEINKNLDQTALLKLSELEIDYVVLHKDLMDPTQLLNLQNNENLYIKGIIFNHFDIVIIDLSRLNLIARVCILERDFDIKFGRAAPAGFIDEVKPLYAMRLKNNSDCYLPSIYEDRYRTIDVTIDGVLRKARLLMPVMIGPGEEVVLSEPSNLRIE